MGRQVGRQRGVSAGSACSPRPIWHRSPSRCAVMSCGGSACGGSSTPMQLPTCSLERKTDFRGLPAIGHVDKQGDTATGGYAGGRHPGRHQPGTHRGSHATQRPARSRGSAVDRAILRAARVAAGHSSVSKKSDSGGSGVVASPDRRRRARERPIACRTNPAAAFRSRVMLPLCWR